MVKILREYPEEQHLEVMREPDGHSKGLSCNNCQVAAVIREASACA